MKRGLPYTIETGLLLWISLTALPALRGQSPFDPGVSAEAAGISEHLEVFTDRSVYIAGEQVLFRVDRILSGNREAGDWSTVFYAELIESDGQVAAKGKFPLTGGRGSGSLRIPSGMLTGTCYLSCYTRWMRNFGPEVYSYLSMKVVNPAHSEVDEPSAAGAHGKEAGRTELIHGNLKCTVGSDQFEGGEEVSLEIFLDQGPGHEIFNGCLTVVPEGAIDTLYGQFEFGKGDLQRDHFALRYLPDLGAGAALSGTVTDPSGQPVPQATLHFALLGNRPDLFSATTDAQGRFIVAGPQGRGNREYFVTPDAAVEKVQVIQIDQEFAGEPFPGVIPSFGLSELERETATRMAIHHQLLSAFIPGAETVSPEGGSQAVSLPFYGGEVQRVHLDQFVMLPTIEEVFINLVPNVDVLLRRSGNRFMVRSLVSPVEFYAPLILVDYIPVFDQQAVFGLDPRTIERIEVINQVYVKGEVVYGGVISLISKQGDMAGIDLPEGAYFFDFSSFDVPAPSPVWSRSEERVPDLRNTIFWLEEFEVDPGQRKQVSFTAPLEPGHYVILVRGTGADGRVLSAVSRFTVGPGTASRKN